MCLWYYSMYRTLPLDNAIDDKVDMVLSVF